jgi:hypothetical protein
MPFKSKSQMRAAFGGYLGKTMKSKASSWAKETPSIKALPKYAGKGTRARLNTAAQKNFFGTKSSFKS